MTNAILFVFCVVYLGMLLGRLPRLQLDRTGVALLGAIVLVTTGAVSASEAARSVHVPTLVLLFAFMVISAQLRLGGLYAATVSRVVGLRASFGVLLGAVILVTGVLSAVFTNDVVCLAAAPVLIEACRQKGLNPVPFLIGLACASNVGSAATLIGNPQNILIGQVLDLSFAGYLLDAGVPALAGLAVVWATLLLQFRREWTGECENARPRDPRGLTWQAVKGLLVTFALLALFLATDWPREVLALAGAGVLLCSRRLHSRGMLGLVDWQLLVLFGGLFIVNHAFQSTGSADAAVEKLAAVGVDLRRPSGMFALGVVLSNAVSNVPAVILLLPYAHGPMAGPVLALSSTLAGNLLVVGSIANIIVIDAARREGIHIGWLQHARTGLPVTLATLALAAVWLVIRYWTST